MKQFYDFLCESCGTAVELRVEIEELPNLECPHCGKKTLRRKFSTFATGPSCSVGKQGKFT